jgi:hypothetical protein
MSSAKNAVIEKLKKIDTALDIELRTLEARFEKKKAKILNRFSEEQGRLVKMLDVIDDDLPTSCAQIIRPLKKKFGKHSTRLIKPATAYREEEHMVLYHMESGFSLERTCPEDEPYLLEEGPSDYAVCIEGDAKARGFTKQRVICFSREGSFLIQLIAEDEMLLRLYSSKGKPLATTSRIYEFVYIDGETIKTTGRLLNIGEFAKVYDFVRTPGCYRYNIPAMTNDITCLVVTGDLLIIKSLASYDHLKGNVLIELSDGSQAWIYAIE